MLCLHVYVALVQDVVTRGEARIHKRTWRDSKGN
jgi:hypothetical protein